MTKANTAINNMFNKFSTGNYNGSVLPFDRHDLANTLTLINFISSYPHGRFKPEKEVQHLINDNVRPLSFRELKKKDRIIPDIDPDWCFSYNTRGTLDEYFHKTFGDINNPPVVEFDFVLDDFVVFIPGKMNERDKLNLYVHVHKKDGFLRESDEFTFIFVDIYAFNSDRGCSLLLSYATLNFFYLDFLKYVTGVMDDDSLYKFGYSVDHLDFMTKSIIIPAYDEFGNIKHCHKLDDIVEDIHVVKKDVDIESIQISSISILLYAMAVNYNVQLQLENLSKVRNSQNNMTKYIKSTPLESTDSGHDNNEQTDMESKEPVIQVKKKDGSRVINLRNISLDLKSKESIKRVQTKARKACDYQYSVAGHFRHYRSGKVVYIKSHNRNTDKPFKGKTILI